MNRHLRQLLADESGSVAIEYGLIISMVVIGLIGVIASLGLNVQNFYLSAAAIFS